MNWEPIKTATKDKEPKLLVCAGYEPVVGQWDDKVGWWFGECDKPNDDWGKDCYRPDYWCELPEWRDLK
jgi:hypothetical protein